MNLQLWKDFKKEEEEKKKKNKKTPWKSDGEKWNKK